MPRLSLTALMLGGIVVLLFAPLLVAPRQALGVIAAFPRNRVLAWLLTAVDLVWAGWLTYHAHFPWIDAHRNWIVVATPIVFVLVVWWMDDLLAPRALGGLFLLLPAPILDAAFLRPERWRLVLVATAYGMVIVGMGLMLNPYWYRKTTSRWLRTEAQCRIWGAAGIVWGAFVAGLGFWALM